MVEGVNVRGSWVEGVWESSTAFAILLQGAHRFWKNKFSQTDAATDRPAEDLRGEGVGLGSGVTADRWSGPNKAPPPSLCNVLSNSHLSTGEVKGCVSPGPARKTETTPVVFMERL